MQNPNKIPADPLFHIAFFKFVELADPDATVTYLRELTKDLTGSILVASEGINGVLAGTAMQLNTFQHELVNDPRLAGQFAGIPFKRSACKTSPFGRIKIHKKAEIVAIGVSGITGVNTKGKSGINVSPAEWRKLIADDDVVVIDNRNSFEYRLGKFKSAIDPQVSHFRDFPKYIEEHVPEWKAAGKRVAMYCTGGIRCEKTSAWMQDFGIDVYQLEGGILNYFLSMPDAEKDWEGECFVFDNRIALDTRLQETDTTLEDVYEGEPDGEWRIARAKRLDESK